MPEFPTKPSLPEYRGGDLFAYAVACELASARHAHPTGIRSCHEGYAILLEEVEELKEEVFKKSSQRSAARMRSELIKIAAMAQRMAEDLGIYLSTEDK